MKKVVFLLMVMQAAVAALAQQGWLTPEALRMKREQIRFTDNQLRLFNGRGAAHVKRYSLTGIHRLQFPPIELANYSFFLNFYEHDADVLIQDNVPDLWEEWIRFGSGTDPLGANFRSGFATIPVTQDEYWEPNRYVRQGTFHKEYSRKTVSFGIKTETVASAKADEVILRMVLTNREPEPLKLSLIPNQQVLAKDNAAASSRLSPFVLAAGDYQVSLSSSISDVDSRGWYVEVPAKGSREVYIAIKMGRKDVATAATDGAVAARFDGAIKDTRQRLSFASSRLPELRSDNRRLEDFYRRCIATMLECRWERENFIINPFWSVGSWVFTITWDNSFASDAISIMDPASMKRTILVAMKEGKLKSTYISWQGGGDGIFYIQEPFALKTMIDAYLRQTGDVAFLDEQVAGKSVMEWMKSWGDLLHAKYRSPFTGLMDMGRKNEELIEMRTDGYSGVVPVVNGLAVDLYRWLDGWCTLRNDGDASKFRGYANDLNDRMHAKLWNRSTRWFDNIYPDGRREPLYSNHLFDLLGTNAITDEERMGIISHLNDQEFLGPYSVYSISRQDKVRWDLIDSDWGGGGSFTGVPLRLARNLYGMGQGPLAWTILSRFSRYADYFPYLGQNLRANEPLQDESSMPIQISSGAGVEAVMFGLFGIKPNIDGTMSVNPHYSLELGRSSLQGYLFRGHSYSFEMDESGFTVSRDGQSFGPFSYGEEAFVGNDGAVSIVKKGLVAPYVRGYRSYFVNRRSVELLADAGTQIRYTLDGSQPSLRSTLYQKSFRIDKSTVVKAIAIKGNEQSLISEVAFEKLHFRDAANSGNVINRYDYPSITPFFTLSESHLPLYGIYTLMDGKHGGDTYRDGQWIGKDKDDVAFLLEWDSPVEVRKVSTRFLQYQPEWIFTPLEFTVEVSLDGKSFKKVGEQSFSIKERFDKKEIVPVVVSFPKEKVRYVRVTAKNMGVCPSWHGGAGGNAWIFMDELIVE